MNLHHCLLTFVYFIHIISCQRTYDAAECNGNQIYSFSSDRNQNSGQVDIILNTTDPTPSIGTVQFTITNPPASATGDIPRWESTAIDPTTGIIYAIIFVPGASTSLDTYYLSTVDLSGDVTIVNEINPRNDVLTGMTFDCDGNLYVIQDESVAFQTFAVFQMDKESGNYTEFIEFTSNCWSPSNGDCVELIGYNWDDGLLYRISNDANAGMILYRVNEDATITEASVSDPNNICLGGGEVLAMEYIGNDLWLISCTADFGATRLLDTSDINNPIIGPIGDAGIVIGNASDGIDRSGAGLIGSTDGNELCVAICPTTTASPTTATPTTATPTTNAPTTDSPTTTPPTTASPTTATPTTAAPTTDAPTTDAPTTAAPTTSAPTTADPTTVAPTTDAPTTTTTTTACVECPFEIVLNEISPLLLSEDCSLHSSSSDSDSSSRRMLSVSDDSDDSDLCLINGNALIFIDSLCVEGGFGSDDWSGSGSGSDDGSGSGSSDGSDSDDGSTSDDGDIMTDTFLAPICVTYSIEYVTVNAEDCGEINNIFMGLCSSVDTDFDVSLLVTGDIDNILDIDGSDNILSAIGYRNDDNELGVQIVVQDPSLSFTLCFVNIAVTETFNDTRYDLAIATNGAIVYTNDDGDVITCTAIGLPCLNFFFGCEDELIGPESVTTSILYGITNGVSYTKRNCDCKGGLTTLTLVYDGSNTAASIIGYDQKNRIVCSFENVEQGSSIICAADKTRRGQFGMKLIFRITYNAQQRTSRRGLVETKCSGKVWTICKHQIYIYALKICNDLTVLSHIDTDGALCEANM